MEKMVRLGILGVGNIGTNHVKRILAGDCPELQLTAVADTRGDRRDRFTEAFGGEIPVFSSAKEMLDSGLIEACLIAVPHYDHPKYVMACIQRGIHVLCEKPSAVYTLAAREMNACAANHPEVVFGMMFNQRTNCIYRKMRELVQSGKYGQIRRTNWIITNWYRSQCYYDSGDWRATWSGEGGGVLLNQCPHNLDLWQWICGMPSKVDCHMHFGKWHDIEVEDDVTCYVEYPNGATGVFVTSTGDGHGTNRFEIQMDGARLVAEDGRLVVDELEIPEPEFRVTNKSPFGKIPFKTFEPETDGQNPQHVGVMNAWAAAIRHGTPLVAHGSEGINGLMLSNAMHLSAFTGKPVALPFDEELFRDEILKRAAASRRKVGVKTVVADTEGSFNSK